VFLHSLDPKFCRHENDLPGNGKVDLAKKCWPTPSAVNLPMRPLRLFHQHHIDGAAIIAQFPRQKRTYIVSGGKTSARPMLFSSWPGWVNTNEEDSVRHVAPQQGGGASLIGLNPSPGRIDAQKKYVSCRATGPGRWNADSHARGTTLGRAGQQR